MHFLKVACNELSLAARAWCQAAAQKFPGGLGSKLCGNFTMIIFWGWWKTFFFFSFLELCRFFFKALLNVNEGDKGASDPPAAKQQPHAAEGSCGCTKDCNCTKAAVRGFSDLYSTGAPHIHTLQKKNKKNQRRLFFSQIKHNCRFLSLFFCIFFIVK